MIPTRGEVWLIKLDPVIGSEQGKMRPCLIVSPPESGPYRLSVIVPLTSRSRPTRFRLPIHFRREGLALVDQVRTISHLRLIKRQGSLDDDDLLRVLAILREMFEE